MCISKAILEAVRIALRSMRAHTLPFRDSDLALRRARVGVGVSCRSGEVEKREKRRTTTNQERGREGETTGQPCCEGEYTPSPHAASKSVLDVYGLDGAHAPYLPSPEGAAAVEEGGGGW